MGEKLVCSRVPPAPIYKGGRRRPAAREEARHRGVQLGFPILVGVPFLFQAVERGKEEEREKERGGRRPLLVQFGPAMGRGRPPLAALLSFPLNPIKAHYFPGGFR